MCFKPEAPSSRLNYRSEMIASRIVKDLLEMLEYEEPQESKVAEEKRCESQYEQERKEIEKCKAWREGKNTLADLDIEKY